MDIQRELNKQEKETRAKLCFLLFFHVGKTKQLIRCSVVSFTLQLAVGKSSLCRSLVQCSVLTSEDRSPSAFNFLNKMPSVREASIIVKYR